MTRSKNWRVFLCACSVTTGLVAGQTTATAQSPAAKNGASGGPETQVLEEIIVTATRREEPIFQVPAAISALSSGELEDRGIDSIEELQYEVPGIQFGQSGGISTIFIRGVGLNEGSGSTSPGVAVYVDGIYQPRPSTADLAQTDLERVEILRGPQGTLYGRNATGGVINFISKAPTTQTEGYFNLGYASFDEITAKGAVNFAISDGVRVRAAASYRKRDQGFVENVAGGPDLDTVDSLSGRLRVSLDLAPNLTADLSAYAVDERNLTYNAYLQPYGADAVALNPILGTAILAARTNRTAANEADPLVRHLKGIDGRLTLQLGNLQLTSTSSYVWHDWGFSRFDNDASNINFMLFGHDEDSETFTQQLDASIDVGRANVLAGVFYLKDDFFEAVPFSGPLGVNLAPFGIFTADPGADIYTSQKKNTRATAGYVDVTVPVTDRFSLIGGARYSHETSDIEQTIRLTGFRSFGFPLGVIFSCQDLQSHPEFNSTTWRGGAQFMPSSSSNVYATASRGFKTGGVNIGECGNTFKPEEVLSYEVGYKTRFFDGGLTLGASLFHYDYENLQLFQFLPLMTLIQNAPQATVDGAELELAFRPDAHWTFSLNGTLLDTEYDDFSSFDDLNRAAGTQNVKGNKLNYAPPYAVNAAIQYQTPQMALGTLTMRIEGKFTGKQYFRPFNEPLDLQDAYQVFNASMVWTSSTELYRARLYARNVSDEEYVQTLGSSGLFGSRFGSYGTPLQFGAEFGISF